MSTAAPIGTGGPGKTPPGPPRSNAGVEAFVDFQGLSSGPATPASLDNAGVGTNPGTEIAYGQNLRRGLRISRADVAHLMLRVLEQAETIKQVIGIAN